MLSQEVQNFSHTINGYKVEDIILWTAGLFLSVVSIIFSILSYYFANKSTKLITELIEKTWVISESDKFLFINMKTIKHNNNNALVLLNSTDNITYEDYVSASIGSRTIHINKETVNFLMNTKYKYIIIDYLAEKKICDDMFFEATNLEKITASSKEIIPDFEIEKLIKYHKRVSKFVSNILREYTALTV